MADPAEAAIKTALLAPLVSFASAQDIPLALPNIPFDQPTPGRGVRWLRATVLPADSIALSLGYDGKVQHYGLLVVDVFHGEGDGEIAPARVAGLVTALYRRGTEMVSDGFAVTVQRAPTIRPAVKDEPWLMLPVMIPYFCYAAPT